MKPPEFSDSQLDAADAQPTRGRREKRSLFGEILDWMLAPLLLLWPMSVALTWLVAQNIAGQPFDQSLTEHTKLLAQQIRPDSEAERFTMPDVLADLLHGNDEEASVFAIYLHSATGKVCVAGDCLAPWPGEGLESARPPQRSQARQSLVQLADWEYRDTKMRLARMEMHPATGNRWFEVWLAESLEKRARLATEIIKGVILPQFVILPVAVLLVWLALARGIAPLSELQARIRRREPDDLSPIDEQAAPEEVAPLVRSINELLARLGDSLAAQKHFLADAAHQLKTPLAGLRMQAELAERHIDAGHLEPMELKRSLQQIALSSQRATHTVNQLLSMARAENLGRIAEQHVPICLPRLAIDVVQDFVPKAFEHRIDLGYEGPDPSPPDDEVRGHPLLLRELIRNLVDNALAYTPAQGSVTVRIVRSPASIQLIVEDNGPGIPAEERDKVFQPFYRSLGTHVDGSGLGLAIVKEIADQHQCILTLEETHPGLERPGARFILDMPLAAR